MTAATAPKIPDGLRAFLAARNVSPRQKVVAEEFYALTAKHGYAPTLDEIGDALGVSRVTVYEHVKCLIHKGVLEQTAKFRGRALCLCWRPDEDLVLENAALRAALRHYAKSSAFGEVARDALRDADRRRAKA